MEVVCKVLADRGFQRVRSKLSVPIIVNCVPGAGKTSAIFDILASDSRFKAVTFGAKQERKIEGLIIDRVVSGCRPPAEFLIVDEYTEGDYGELDPFVIFGDPNQSRTDSCLRPHWLSFKTFRFGSSTCFYLNKLGFKIESDKEDSFKVCKASECDIEGQLIVYGQQALTLASWYGLEFLCLEAARGRTFEVCTVLTDYESVTDEIRGDLFVLLTRHRSKCVVLNGDATLAAT